MPVYDSTTEEKIVELRGLDRLGVSIEVHELVKINWPSPDGAIYYASTQIDEVASVPPPVSPIDCRLIPESIPEWFSELILGASIGDEEVDLEMWDADGVISDLIVDYNEGVKAEFFYWFPQVELLLPIWHGHTRFEEEGTVDRIRIKVVQGFSSADGDVPKRAHYPQCQRPFGGLFDTQAEIDESGCNYNLHLGGTFGIVNPGTGQPWTFCDRRSTASCTARGINPLRHLSHATVQAVIANNQTSGPRLYSTSFGNETNLKEPVRVVMGKRRIYDMKVMAFRRDLNNNNPNAGWFAALYEACEGPVKSLTNSRITVGGKTQNANAQHYSYRPGQLAQGPLDIGLTPTNYSDTALIQYRFGPIDPTTVDESGANASSLIEGLNNIRQHVAAGNGLLAEYFFEEFAEAVGEAIVNTVNFPSNTNSPHPNVGQIGWSCRFSGTVTPEFTETYTFELEHDDGAKLWINNTVVIDQLAVNGTHTGTIALTAGVPVSIRLDFLQSNVTTTNPWKVILRWSSASRSLQVVPFERLNHPATVIRNYTTNRVWHIARIMTDKRWGYGLDFELLDADSWLAAAEWAEEVVRYTDVNGTNWDHTRADSHLDLMAKKVQQQIDDICIAGRLSRPFLFNGKIHIVPLAALTEEELAAAPVFTDIGEDRNVVWEGNQSTLKISRKSSLDLPNRIECTFDDVLQDYKQQPLQPIEDIDAQLAAGRVRGDNSQKINIKKSSLQGVVTEAQAMKMAWSLLDLGELDDGGLANNCRIKFQTWFIEALELHPHKVIKFNNPARLDRYGFEYFRILPEGIKRKSDLIVEIEAQAYNVDYMDSFETVLSTLPGPPLPPGEPMPPGPTPIPCTLQFGMVTYTNGTLEIPIPQC